MADTLISRAQILMQQNRYEEAGDILTNLLNHEPNNVQVLAMLSQVKLAQQNTKAAEELINSAIGLSPDVDYLYYVKATVCLRHKQYDEAENYLKQAIELNPEDADYFALWASIKLIRKQYEKALNLANEALELDPENIAGLNTRSTALLKLNRKEDSFSTIEGALAHDPNNAYTHSNYGWGLLEKGNHKKALEHFREALKNDPNLQHAQAGMAQALKAKYLFYRLFLRYAFFMSNLTAKYQWGVIIGFYIATRILRSLAQNFEGLQPILIPVIILIALAAFTTWVIGPISNLFLRLNPYGKYLLDKDEKLSSGFVGISILVCIAGLIMYMLQSNVSWLVVAAFGFAMMVPLGSMFSSATHKNKMIGYAIIMSLLGIVGIVMAFTTGEPFNMFTIIFTLGFVAFQWISNYLNIKQSNI
ncbi:MAG: tetratricopeptide repeat protein [Ginsengibacter sp.]